jgi:hypothetical protein
MLAATSDAGLAKQLVSHVWVGGILIPLPLIRGYGEVLGVGEGSGEINSAIGVA